MFQDKFWQPLFNSHFLHKDQKDISIQSIKNWMTCKYKESWEKEWNSKAQYP